MFWFRDSRAATTADDPAPGTRVEVAFTDADLDLQGLRPGFPQALAELEQACGVRFARLHQVHGERVVVAHRPEVDAAADPEEADALVTTTPGVGLMVRAADCVPVVLADPGAGVVGAVHAGRGGMVLDVVTRTLETMTRHGADPAATTAWLGPHVCGGCYEVPSKMRDEVAAAVPESWAETTWGTPSLDLGAGVGAQLLRAGVEVVATGGCTREEPRLPSYRRDGGGSGRLAGTVWLR